MGKKRGKIYIPTYNEAEQAAMARAAEVADAVRLDDDEEAALGMVSNMMSLVTIFGYKRKMFTISERPHVFARNCMVFCLIFFGKVT